MIFVTGGTGVLGSHLLYELTRNGESVRAIYRDESKINSVKRVFDHYNPSEGRHYFSKIEWIECDVLDLIALEDAMQGCVLVYHCAALVSFQKKDFFKMMKINRQGTANIVNLSLDLKVRKLCFVSSTAAVSQDPQRTNEALVEKNKWIQTPETSGYAISKYSSEKEVWRGIEEGLDAVIINPSMILGAGSWNESSLTILRTIASGFKFYTHGSNAFVDARDVATGMVQLMNSDVKNERFLCTGQNVAFRTLFTLVAEQMHVKPPSIYAGPFLSGIARRLDYLISIFTGKRSLTKETVLSAQAKTVYDSSKIKNAIGIEFRSLDETIRNAIAGKID